MKSIKLYLGEQLTQQGFNVKKGNFWYKLENELLYRFGIVRNSIVCEVSPLFCFVELSGYNRTCTLPIVPSKYLINPLIKYTSNHPCIENALREYYDIIWKEYVFPYFNEITSVRTNLEYLMQARIDFQTSKDNVDSNLPESYRYLGSSEAITAHLIYLKEYDELEKHLLADIALKYQEALKNHMNYETCCFDSAEQAISSVSRHSQQILSYSGLMTSGNIIRKLKSGDISSMWAMLEGIRQKNVDALVKIWPKREKLPDWAMKRIEC